MCVIGGTGGETTVHGPGEGLNERKRESVGVLWPRDSGLNREVERTREQGKGSRYNHHDRLDDSSTPGPLP